MEFALSSRELSKEGGSGRPWLGSDIVPTGEEARTTRKAVVIWGHSKKLRKYSSTKG